MKGMIEYTPTSLKVPDTPSKNLIKVSKKMKLNGVV